MTSNFIPSSRWSFGPAVTYRPERDDVENGAVNALHHVDEAVEVGPLFGVNFDEWTTTFKTVWDVSDGHDGFLFTISAEYRKLISDRLMLWLEFSTTYADDKYMQSYFGITGADAINSGLKPFDAEGGFKDIGLKLKARYMLWREWNIQATAGYTRLLGDAADSPIVEDHGDANQYSGGIIFIYTFD